MLIQWYKNIAFISAILWTGLGVLTIGSIALSSIGWAINLIIGLLFMLIAYFLYLRVKNLHCFYETIPSDAQNNPHLQRFLRLEMIFVLGTCFFGIILLSAGISRVFGEGYAIFG